MNVSPMDVEKRLRKIGFLIDRNTDRLEIQDYYLETLLGNPKDTEIHQKAMKEAQRLVAYYTREIATLRSEQASLNHLLYGEMPEKVVKA